MKALSRNLLAGALLAALPMGGALACTTSAWTNGAATTAVAGSPPTIARYSGECGLQPAGATPFVVDNSPANETDYRARFYVYTGSASGTPVVFRATDADGGAGATLVQVTFDAANSEFDITSGSASTSVPAQAGKWYSVEVYYDAGAALSGTVQGAGSSTAANFNLTTGVAAGSVNSAQLGAISGGSNVTTMRFDEFESTRSTTTAIGRLLRGDANGDTGVSGPDIVLVAREASALAVATGQPDCNEDGGVSGPDIVCVARIASGLDTP